MVWNSLMFNLRSIVSIFTVTSLLLLSATSFANEETAQFCKAPNLTLKWTKRNTDSFGWFYSIAVTNPYGSEVRVYITVYDTSGKSQNIWNPRMKPGETRTVVNSHPIGFPSEPGDVRWVACHIDRADSTQCARYCKHTY